MTRAACSTRISAITSSAAPMGRYALCVMCIGVGQGIAIVVERV
jgi:acetyl-CoA acetyltransferase